MKRLSLLIVAGMLLFAGNASAAEVKIEAEDFSVLTGNRIENVSGVNPAFTSGGALKVFYTNGTIGTTVSGAVTNVTARLRGGQACGPQRPRAIVKLDGVTIADTFVDPLGWASYEAPVSAAAGEHQLTIGFINDFYDPPNCDLNLRADFVNVTTDETPPPPPPPPTGELKWLADAEGSEATCLGRSCEWSAISCAASDRRSVVTTPVLKGSRAYSHRLQDGDDSYGERCESSQGNTSSSNLHPDRLYNEGDKLWIAFGVYIPDGFTFCSPSDSGCHTRGDGGLITQEKQLGSCGTPAAGIVAVRPDGTDSSIALRQRNSAETDCGNASMKTLWDVPVQRNKWIKVVRYFHFQPNATGWIETYIDSDGNGTNDFVPVPPSVDGVSKTVTRVSSPFGGEDGYRIFTWTQKSGSSVDHPTQCVSDQCSHQRIGIYRDPDVDGSSIVYHDGIAVGLTAGDVVAAAF